LISTLSNPQEDFLQKGTWQDKQQGNQEGNQEADPSSRAAFILIASIFEASSIPGPREP
jgi:hypothetical protein